MAKRSKAAEESEPARSMAENSEPKRSRAAFPTVVFIVGVTPYRETLLLPRVSRLSVAAVRQALEEQEATCKPLPHPLPRGCFVVERYVEDVQVALYKFDTAEGCRNTTSAQHDLLPVPAVRHRDVVKFTVEPRVHVGFQYLYGSPHAYKIVDGKVDLGRMLPSSVHTCSPVPEKRSENFRTCNLVTQLQQQFEKRFVIEAFKRKI